MNSVTVDSMHYERLVRDAIKYDQLRAILVKSLDFNKWKDGLYFDSDTLSDGLNAIMSNSEFSDLKCRYEYLKQKFKDEEARKEAEKLANEQFDKNSAYPESVKL